ncbi:MAG: 2-phospho-L-lactate transferase [Candidatus Binatia bacterium]
MVVVLTGGTGGAKLTHGLSLVLPQEELFIVCNTGDDFILHGLHISPDLDTIIYTLAGIADPAKGWGIKDDTFNFLEALARLGGEAWFKLGDRDLATHITRTALLAKGRPLSQATETVCKALGVKSVVVPMSDDRIETRIVTPAGEISFQEFFVKRRCADEVTAVKFSGAESSRPSPGIEAAILAAPLVIVCPSNPVTSMGPILAVPGIRAALKQTRARVIAVSPIIRDAPFSGPAHKLMAAAGMEVSAFGVAVAYADFLDLIFIAREDRALTEQFYTLKVEARTAAILLDSPAARARLAKEIVAAAAYAP